MMDLPALLKILSIFAGILLLIRFKCHTGLALTTGGMLLGLWAGKLPGEVLHDAGTTLISAELWLLLCITALIFEYGRHLAQPDNARVIMRAARALGGRHGRAVSLMTVPAAIGLVPMPGGALFSAPLVDQAAHGSSWSVGWKSAVNYWFRHVWEYWWPLFPVVIVTLSIFEMELGWFILMQLPLSVTVWAAGYAILVRPHLRQLAEEDTVKPPDPSSDTRGWLIGLPLLIVILGTIFLPGVIRTAFPAWTASTAKMTGMLVGLSLGLGLILRSSGSGASGRFVRTLYDKKVLSLLGTIAGVLLFKNFLEQSQLLPVAGDELIHSGIPLVVVVALLPLVAGLVTGIAIGFAGVAFPLLAGLASTPETGLYPASTLLLGFAFGYAGMMCSPVHLCFILTRSHFSAPIESVYRYIIPLSIFPLLTAIVLYIGLRYAGL